MIIFINLHLAFLNVILNLEDISISKTDIHDEVYRVELETYNMKTY